MDSSRVGDDVVVKGTTIVQPGSRLSGDKVIETGEITPKNDGHEKPQPEPGNKYILHPLDKDHWFDDVPLFQIEAVCDFGDIPKGSLGGYVHSEKNLSHEGFSWIEDGACVLNDAVVNAVASTHGVLPLVHLDHPIIDCNSIAQDVEIVPAVNV